MPTWNQYAPGNPEVLFTNTTTRPEQIEYGGDSTAWDYGFGGFSVAGIHLHITGFGFSGTIDDEEYHPDFVGTITGLTIVSSDAFPVVEMTGLSMSMTQLYAVVINGSASTLRTFIEEQSWTFNGSAGNDDLTGGNSKDVMLGSAGLDTIRGLGGNDTLDGGTGADIIDGGAGNDSLIGGTGADQLTGGLGNDTYFVDNVHDNVFEFNGAGTDSVISSVSFSLAGQYIEKLTLTGSADINGVGNLLANNLIGNSGNNILNGGSGSDRLTGLGGNDTFVFKSALGATNIDTIIDFSVVEDTIQLENSIFTEVAGVGTLTVAQFVATASGVAQDGSDRIVYEIDTGKLFYDSNGSAAGGSVQFATLSAGLNLTNLDFTVI